MLFDLPGTGCFHLLLENRQLSQQLLAMIFCKLLQDPLVVNFEGTAAELSQTRFQFDLDSERWGKR